MSSTQPLLTPTTPSRFLALYLDGQWAVSFRALGEFWVLIWEVDANVAAIRHIGEVTSIGG